MLKDWTGVKIRIAEPLDGNPGGGVVEYIVPDPVRQIDIMPVSIKLDSPL